VFYLEKSSFIFIVEGIIRSFIATLILLLLISVVTTIISVPVGIQSTLLLITTVLSVMYGAIYSTRKIQKKGWIIGILIAFFYMLILFIILLCKNGLDYFTIKHLFKLLLALMVGALSGMLGINI
jgi:putative membrane protein (TIGR04086 family)